MVGAKLVKTSKEDEVRGSHGTQEIEVNCELVGTESARSIPDIASEVQLSQEHVLIVGCGGLLQVPAAQQADYFRAHGFVAILGAICWLLFFLTGLLI